MLIRKANLSDIEQITEMYNKIHTIEEAGKTAIGWVRTVYPTRFTAQSCIADGDLFVAKDGGRVVASVCINRNQAPEYRDVPFTPANESEVMVLHTLAVDPDCQGMGYGSKMVEFYEDYARHHGCRFLRLDTNATNLKARQFYINHGFKEVATVPYHFEGIPNLNIVCLEKAL